jgi:hypothetical protein
MIEGELDEFKYSFSQIGLNKSGNDDEQQWLTLRAVDGIAGRFYQIVLCDKLGEEKFWSFTEPEDILPMLKKFIAWSEKIDDM